AKRIAGDKKAIALIHDGVRPLINGKLISENIACVKQRGSAITAGVVKETIVVVEEGKIEQVPTRDKSRVAKAPQSFWLDDILSAHKKAMDEGIYDTVDSCTLMQRYGYPLYMVDGPYDNIKITTPDDYYAMRAILQAKEDAQIYGLED
ncbi:MAG: 2-C-methyl-D-erythritol 4-phosphate cytidylyltransferase, partial [Clostridia bacterium]|nr:2-C-methyl-D-erythritol 4-phosphate cytidylyltransferase [Clostridia bacterium]